MAPGEWRSLRLPIGEWVELRLAHVECRVLQSIDHIIAVYVDQRRGERRVTVVAAESDISAGGSREYVVHPDDGQRLIDLLRYRCVSPIPETPPDNEEKETPNGTR